MIFRLRYGTEYALIFLMRRALSSYFLAEDEFEIRHVVLGDVSRVFVVFGLGVRLRRRLNLHFHDLVLERLEHLLSHILHHVFVGYLDCMLEQLLGQVFVDVPDQAAGHFLQMGAKSDRYLSIRYLIVQHVIVLK